MKNKILVACLLLAMSVFAAENEENSFSSFRIRHLTTKNGLPNNDVQNIYQDKDGYIWMATRNGLCRYDGYTVYTYKSNLHTPKLLTNNNISCLVEDDEHRLWIGTYDGLNVLDKTTGQIKQIDLEVFHENPISRMLVYDDYLFICTEMGLFKYIPAQDSVIAFSEENTAGIFPRYAVAKCIYKDSRGDIWIGTWSNGLFRYDPQLDKFYHYPKMNDAQSAHVVFEDSYHRIWIGTWNHGLILLDTPYDPNTTWKTFQHVDNNPKSLSDNLIYSISEDMQANALWVGTRSGLSIMSLKGNYEFENYYPNHSTKSIPANEVNAIIRDNKGIMWLGMVGGGVSSIITRIPDFQMDRLDDIGEHLLSNSVRAILQDNEQQLWLGIGTYGFVVQNRKTGKWIHCSDMPDFKNIDIPTVMHIMQSPTTGKIWISTYNGGVFVYDKTAPKGKRVQNYIQSESDFLPSSCVYCTMEDAKGNYWFATRFGIGLLTPDGKGYTFGNMYIDGKRMESMLVQAIADDGDNGIWLATGNRGVIHLTPATGAYSVNGYKGTSYSLENGNLNTQNTACLYVDAQKRVWVGSEGGALSLYIAEKDAFVSVYEALNLQSDGVSSILGDKQGNLWLATNEGLLRLNVASEIANSTFRIFTTSDGTNDNIFNKNVAFAATDGELFFGSHSGYTSFYPEKVQDPISLPKMMITDIKILNKSWNTYPEETRIKISPKDPWFTKNITLNHKQNNFSVEFTALDYTDPMRNRYAYKLDGFDKDWRYTDASRRFAYYNNLPYGSYTLLLKATNSTITWDELPPLKLKVEIKPPLWQTWWAYLCYIIIVVGVAYSIMRTTRNRMLLRNELHLSEMDKIRSEELNHAKLQFFTNITHELLTPLTIISATIDELKICVPQQIEYYQLMTNNINRLIRLIQQILEFRKAETGNLKLKVAQGDLAMFLQNSVETFKPLMKKKQIQLSVTCDVPSLPAYFDPDKIDKVLYNLLSNAAKYNQQDGTVSVCMKSDAESGLATILVTDNGQGISKEAQQNLFKRFYEGDYRKFHTIGTGIGLSLCRDLMKLHKGSISVESELGKGTTFKIVFPIQRNAYTEDEIDDTIVVTATAPLVEGINDVDVNNEINEGDSKEYSLLLIEDNEELLMMMNRLLSAEYIVYTATNGREGLEIIDHEYIDLIVSDVMMPEMDGIAFCRSLKSNVDSCHIPVILLTAKNTQQDRVEAYDSGADAFISKPFNLSLLHSRISNLLKARERTNKDFKKQLVFEAKELNYTSIDEEFLQRAIECVHKHLDESEFDQMQFVSEMGTSKSTLFRKLKSLTGLSSSSFIRNIRLKAACQIMEEKQRIRVSELAYAVGFNDPKYFSSCFKKEFGIQPSEYMDKFILKDDEKKMTD